MMQITIERASAEDIPVLAELNRQAYCLEIASRISWKNWPDEENMRNFFISRLTQRFGTESSDIFKAISSETRDIIGLIAWSREQQAAEGAEIARPTPTANAARRLPPGLNAEFVMKAGGEIERMRELMNGETHYYVSAFAVPPKYQGQGVGTQLLQHCLSIADSASLPSWLIAFPGSHDLYLRHGFVDIQYVDIDLNEYDQKRYRGFGIYRNYAMCRRPQGVPSDPAPKS